MPEFTFEEKGHIYRLDGRRLLSTTEILDDNGLIKSQFIPESALIRGTRVHLLCQFLDEGDYSPAQAKKFEVEGYVESWRKFKERKKVEILEIERPMYHPTWSYAGTPDRLIMLDKHPTVIDIKSGPFEFWHVYQVAAYEMLYAFERKFPEFRRASVHLKEDGSLPDCQPHHDTDDSGYFLSMLAVTNLRRKHGIEQ